MKKSKSLLEENGIRKTKKQKTSFIQHLCASAASEGYVSDIEQMKSGSRNVVVGLLDKADVVFTAHYDTPSRSLIPTVITPKTPWLSTLSRSLAAIIVLIPTFAVFLVLAMLLPGAGILPTVAALISIVAAVSVFILGMILFVCGPARADNANSNGSGVLALLTIMDKMPRELREKVAFVFLDNQENGYIGAADFAKKHKHDIKEKLFINLDSVGVGDDFVVAGVRGAKISREVLSEAFASSEKKTVTFMNGAKHIPSDHIKLKHAIGISAFKKTSSGMLYINKLTTSGDTECNDENIEFLTAAAIKLAEKISESKTEAAPEKPVSDSLPDEKREDVTEAPKEEAVSNDEAYAESTAAEEVAQTDIPEADTLSIDSEENSEPEVSEEISSSEISEEYTEAVTAEEATKTESPVSESE